MYPTRTNIQNILIDINVPPIKASEIQDSIPDIDMSDAALRDCVQRALSLKDTSTSGPVLEFEPDKLLERLVREMHNGHRSGFYGWLQSYAAYESNAINQTSLTRKQVYELHATQKLESNLVLTIKHVEEIQGHFLAVQKMIELAHEPLSIHILKGLHSELMLGVYHARAIGMPIGEWRSIDTVVGDLVIVPPAHIDATMQGILDRYNGLLNPGIRDILELMYAIVRCHPFSDGNGRIARIVLLRECLRHGIVPIIIPAGLAGVYLQFIRSHGVDEIRKHVNRWQDTVVKWKEDDVFSSITKSLI